MNTQNLEPFDLERAKAGEAICDKEGLIEHFVGVTKTGNFVVVERPIGRVHREYPENLRMAPRPTVKKTIWVGRYLNLDKSWRICNVCHFKSKEDCEKAGSEHIDFIEAVAVEITEPAPFKKKTVEIPVYIDDTAKLEINRKNWNSIVIACYSEYNYKSNAKIVF